MPAGTIFAMQNIPDVPKEGSLTIEIVAQNTREITTAYTEVKRDYRLVYFGKSNMDVLDVSDILRKNITNQTKMAVSTGHMTLGAFSMSQIFKTENKVDATIFMLQTSFVEKRTFEDVPKMGDIGIILQPPSVEIPIEIPVPCSLKKGGN
ncbi:hypothetical protein [Metabacillus fastidiosus]|uniref:Cohesin domain-containing protein n=1 Tax=Metabacillus fastidiosus TaxID=1458 RepID=A0ABU6NU65_9BACI|nr:hypothetical protein [Metabacillus fastidiosus]